MPGSAQDAAGGGGKRGEKIDGHLALPCLDFFRKNKVQTEMLPAQFKGLGHRDCLRGGKRLGWRGLNCNHIPRLRIHGTGRGRKAAAGLRLKKIMMQTEMQIKDTMSA